MFLARSSVEGLAYFCHIKPFFGSVHMFMHLFKDVMYIMRRGITSHTTYNRKNKLNPAFLLSSESTRRNLLVVPAMFLAFFASFDVLTRMSVDDQILLKIDLFLNSAAVVSI